MRLAGEAHPAAFAADQRLVAGGRDLCEGQGLACRCPTQQLSGLTKGIARDVDAVRAGIVERWSTSPIEGQINRLKTIKRQMYGRADNNLLRARMLVAA